MGGAAVPGTDAGLEAADPEADPETADPGSDSSSDAAEADGADAGAEPAEAAPDPADSDDPAIPGDESGLYATLPFASGPAPVRARVSYPLPLIGVALVVSLALIGFATIGNGSAPRVGAPPSTVPAIAPIATTTTTDHPVTKTSGAAPAPPTTTESNGVGPAQVMAAIGVGPGDLGNQWIDLGATQPTATGGPASACQTAEAIFSAAATVAGHQYAFSSQSVNAGNLVSAVADTGSAATASTAMRTVRDSDFSTCAEATAEQWLDKAVTGPVIQAATAQRTDLVTASGVVGWRARVSFDGPAGPGTFAMDLFYVSSGSRLAAVQVSRCACPTPPLQATSPLLPDEVLAASAVADRIAASVTDLAKFADAGSTIGGGTTGPCVLLSDTQLTGLLPAQTAGSEGTLSDGANECSWPQGWAVLAIETGDTSGQFATRISDAPEALHGVGDQAAAGPDLSGKVLARKGQIWVEVFVDGSIVDRINAITVIKSILAEL